jgi:hypothetical protein
MARPSPLETTETRWRRRDTRTCSLFRVPRVAHVQPLLCPSRRARAASVAPSVSVPSRSFHPPSSRTPLPPLTRTSRLPPPPFLGQRHTRGWAGRCWGTSCRCSRPSSSPPPTPCRPAGARRRWRSCWTRSRCVWATGQGTRAALRGTDDAEQGSRHRGHSTGYTTGAAVLLDSLRVRRTLRHSLPHSLPHPLHAAGSARPKSPARCTACLPTSPAAARAHCAPFAARAGGVLFRCACACLARPRRRGARRVGRRRASAARSRPRPRPL